MCHLSILHYTCYKLCFFVRTWRPLAMASAECCRGWEEAHEVRLQPAKGKTNTYLNLFFAKLWKKYPRNNRIHTKFNLGLEKIIGSGSFSLRFRQLCVCAAIGSNLSADRCLYHITNSGHHHRWLHFGKSKFLPMGLEITPTISFYWTRIVACLGQTGTFLWCEEICKWEMNHHVKKGQTRKHKEKGDGQQMSLMFSCGNLLLLFWPSSWWS